MRNFAMLGKWHVHAEGYAKELSALEGCRVTKVWDASAEDAQKWADALSCESASAESILTDPTIEGVIVCNATNQHAPLLIRACEAGKAVFTEKVLTLTAKEAAQVKRVVEENGTRFAISFPHLSDPRVRFALDAARAGKLGKINYARVRKAHDGASHDWLPPHFYDGVACGGGAMVDLGAHPMYVLCEILGEPETVRSAFTHVTGKAVEDNAVTVMTYAGGAIGVAETGFVSFKNPFTVEIGGDAGCLLLRGDQLTYCCEETGRQWITPDVPSERLPSPLKTWATAQKPEDIPPEIGIEAAARLSRVMERAYQ